MNLVQHLPNSTITSQMPLLLRKCYAEFPHCLMDLALQQRVRNVARVGDLFVTSMNGVAYIFEKDRISVYAESSLDFFTVRSKIFQAINSKPTGKTTIIVFETPVKLVESIPDSDLVLDTIHYRISCQPPPGVEINIFEPTIHPDCVLKIRPFTDGFTVTFHFKPTGKCHIVCDARQVTSDANATTLNESHFRARAMNVMELLENLLQWTDE